MEEEKIDPGHKQARSVLRLVGPVIAALGLILTVAGLGSFLIALAGGAPPRYFWLALIGLPLLFVGSTLCLFGFIGKMARYGAGEMAPVGKDTFNYMAGGTEDGVRTVAKAVGEGIGTGLVAGQTTGPEAKLRCHKCNNLVDTDAKFCGECGVAVAKTKECPECRELNDPDAKFCDNCGYRYG